MIKGHIYRLLWNNTKHSNEQFLDVGLIIKDLDNNEIFIKGSMRIQPYPSINDYIIANNTGKIYKNEKYKNNIYICSSISIELPIKEEYIINKIKLLSNKSLTKKEITFLLENNNNIWDSINNNNLIFGKIKEHKIDIIYCNFNNFFKNDKEKLNDFLDMSDINLKNNQIDNLIITYHNFDKIIDIMNNKLIDLLSINGFSIYTLINIAQKLNHSNDDKIKLFIMKDLIYSANGDTCIKYDKLLTNLLKEIGSTLVKTLDKKYINNIIDELIFSKHIMKYNEFLYDNEIFNKELNIGNYLKYINNDTPYLAQFFDYALDFLDNFSNNPLNTPLNTEQTNSFFSIFKSNVNITIGPAGTGKSEIITRLCSFIDIEQSISILFLTPTGKACDRLTKGFKKKGLDKYVSYTIHKFIYYKSYKNDSNKNDSNKNDYNKNDYNKNDYNKDEYNDYNNKDFDNIISSQYKIFVIDEMSMISLNIFDQFLKKISNFQNCVLLLLGDSNQLPSIECGDVLNNLVMSNAFNVIRLIKIFRSDTEGLIQVQNNILNFSPLLDNIPLNDNSFTWIKINPLDKDKVLTIFNSFEQLPLIITSTNKVVNEYQNIIKNIYNIDFLEKNSVVINNQIFHIDDNIIILKNFPDKQLMNGMVGKIKNIIKYNNDNPIVSQIKYINNIDDDTNIVQLNILFDGENISRSHIFSIDDKYISLAYITTIHKSQGSEADNVVILIDEAYKLNTINLLYTAITRSKKKCILIAEDNTINSIIEEKRITKRISNLKDFCL
jgi:exodeoxyribonuclease V alpha subunit